MTCKEDKDFSLKLCATLDSLGFKKENVFLRSKYLEDNTEYIYSTLKRFVGYGFTLISAGSAAEGIRLSGSDLDVMFVLEDAVCLDHGDVNEQFTILETDYTNTAPGYTKLLSVSESLSSLGTLLMSMTNYTVGNYPYISSTKFRHVIFDLMSFVDKIMRYENYECERTTNGPAVTNKITVASSFESDNVFSIYFYGGGYLPRWANRARYCNWPSENTIKDISEMEGYVVPVGDKQSENKDLEWRICYTTAEKKLISNLNSIQMKLYVLLKLLAKHILKPVCKALTSYVVKNVVFWITETTPREVFSPDNLVHLVLKSLHFIKHCFENNHFPNYMIPERNLFRGAVCGPEKRAIIKFLSECLTEGRNVILKIPKVYQSMSFMVKYPESMTRYGKWRDEVERLEMVVLRQNLNTFDPKSLSSPSLMNEIPNNFRITETVTQLILLVVPEFPSLLFTGKAQEAEKLYQERLKTIKIM